VCRRRFSEHLQWLNSAIAVTCFGKHFQGLSTSAAPDGRLGRPVVTLAVVYTPLEYPRSAAPIPAAPGSVRRVVARRCLAHVPGGKEDSGGTTLSRFCCRLRH